MKRVTSFFFLLFFTFFSTAVLAQEDAIVGNWQDKAHKNKQVQMYVKDKKYFGKSLDNQSKLVFKDLTWNATKQVYEGVLVHPDRDETYKIEIKMIGKNTFQFTVGSFIFKNTFEFFRI